MKFYNDWLLGKGVCGSGESNGKDGKHKTKALITTESGACLVVRYGIPAVSGISGDVNLGLSQEEVADLFEMHVPTLVPIPVSAPIYLHPFSFPPTST